MTQQRHEAAVVGRSTDDYFQRRLEVKLEAERLIGKQGWPLLSRYGRIMKGSHSGSYVSGVPFAVQLNLVHRLSRGETVPVHLMHRHRAGDDSSWLRWSQGDGFVMVFQDREEKG
jgi:hypothetical protein